MDNMTIEKITISEGSREIVKKGNFPKLESQIILADKINEIIDCINKGKDQLLV